MPLLVSSNWFAWGIGICGFVFYEGMVLIVRGWSDLMQRWKQNLSIGIVAASATYLVLFVCSAIITTYDVHHDEVGRWQATVKEKDQLKRELSKRDAYLKELQERPPVARMQLQSGNKEISSIGPITMASSHYDSIHTDAPYCEKLIFTSQFSVKNVGLRVSLSATVKYVDPLITFVYKGWAKTDEKDPTKVNIAMLGFNGDVLLPERPIVISVCSDKPITRTGLERRNVVEE